MTTGTAVSGAASWLLTAGGDPMIPETTIYGATAGAVAIIAVLFALVALRQGFSRLHLLYIVGAAAVAGGQALMWQEILTFGTVGAERPHGRYVGYAVWYGIVVYIISASAEVSRLKALVLGLVIYVTPSATVASWHLEGTLSNLTLLLTLLAIFAGAYLLVFPFGRAAQSVAPDKRLLFTRVRNVVLLIFFSLPVLGVVSRHSEIVTLTDEFVGVTLASYIDVLFMSSVALIILLSPSDVLDQGDSRETHSDTDRSSAATTD